MAEWLSVRQGTRKVPYRGSIPFSASIFLSKQRIHRWKQRKFTTSLQEVGVLSTFDYRNMGCNTYSLSKGTWIAMIDG